MRRRAFSRPAAPATPGARSLRVAAALLALLGAGCAGWGPLARDGPSAAPREIALFPLNVVLPPPAGLESAVPSVDDAIRAYVEGRVARVESPTREQALGAWLASAQAHREEVGPAAMSFEGAAAILARRFGEEHRFDALVIPWIALRPAKVRGRTVTWDGVSRRLRVRNPQGRSLQVLKDFQADAAAPSLQLVALAPDGRMLFEGAGGLDLIHALVLQGQPTRIDAELLPSAEIFTDRTPVQEGIEVAFDPFLPRR